MTRVQSELGSAGVGHDEIEWHREVLELGQQFIQKIGVVHVEHDSDASGSVRSVEGMRPLRRNARSKLSGTPCYPVFKRRRVGCGDGRGGRFCQCSRKYAETAAQDALETTK
ncbi:hypothetical protein GCM10022381_16360 [Leifsonia kafniensis]|uniref:Uncharacterized protein n=1 Tax=Leifsonia kafniensis TaxID=475957 RepID=A0ABP7KEJ2_9MICO